MTTKRKVKRRKRGAVKPALRVKEGKLHQEQWKERKNKRGKVVSKAQLKKARKYVPKDVNDNG